MSLTFILSWSIWQEVFYLIYLIIVFKRIKIESMLDLLKAFDLNLSITNID